LNEVLFGGDLLFQIQASMRTEAVSLKITPNPEKQDL